MSEPRVQIGVMVDGRAVTPATCPADDRGLVAADLAALLALYAPPKPAPKVAPIELAPLAEAVRP